MAEALAAEAVEEAVPSVAAAEGGGVASLPVLSGKRSSSESSAVIMIDEMMEYYTCPICFDEINRCVMTLCGHNYCEECIRECINLKHICPLCNAELTVDGLVRNHHLDSVLSKLKRTRDDSAKQYVSQIMTAAVGAKHSESVGAAKLSPIAEIFARATASTLVKFENYYQSLVRDKNMQFLRRKDELREDSVLLLPSLLGPFDSALKKALVPKAMSDHSRESVLMSSSMEPGALPPSSSSSSAVGSSIGPLPSSSSAASSDGFLPGSLERQLTADQMDSAVLSAMAEMESAEEGAVSDFGMRQKAQELFLSILQTDLSDSKQVTSENIESLLRGVCDEFTGFIKSNLSSLGLGSSSSGVTDLLVARLEGVMNTYITSTVKTEEQFGRSKALLLRSYEEYMTSVAPSPFLLPVSVTIRVRGRRNHWDGVSLKSTDPMSRVFDIVQSKFVDMGDPIDSFKEGQVRKLGLMRPLRDVSDMKDQKDESEDESMEVIIDLDKCVKEYSLRPGSTILVLTEFVLKSEAPRPCFTYFYEKGKDLKTDYFKCLTCKFNWVCKACAQQCHKGHDLQTFMKDHKPSYACCYCVKKKKCRIENMKTKAKALRR